MKKKVFILRTYIFSLFIFICSDPLLALNEELVEAIKGHKTQTVQNILLNPPIQINEPDQEGNTVLHAAVNQEVELFDIVKLLCEKGADASQYNLAKITPFHLACREGHYNTVNFFLN